MKLFKTLATTAVITLGAVGAVGAVGQTAASAAVAPVRVSATADCSQSRSIQTTAQVSHASSQSQWVYARAYYYKWVNGKWTYTSSVDKQVLATGKGELIGLNASVTAAATANGPAYFYVGVQTWTWTGSAWANNGVQWINSYTVRGANGSTYQNGFCTVVDAARFPF